MARNIGATLTLKDGNFSSNIKSAVSGSKNLKSALGGTTSGLKSAGLQTKSLGDNLGSLAKKAVGVVAGYAGFRQIANFTKDCIEASDAQVKAETRLEQLMSNVKGTTQDSISAVKQYASELQKVTTVGDEVSMVGASQLATFQLQSDSIKKLMPALNDLAVGTYGATVSQDQMQQSANLMGKVMQGNVGALTRVGVTFDKNQEKILKTGSETERAAMLVDVLKQNYGGLAEAMAQTPEGRVIQLKNAWGDVKEVIGAKLYPVVTNVLGWIAEKVPVIQETVCGAIDRVSPVVEKVVGGIKTGVEGAANVVKFLADNWEWLEPIVVGVASAFAVYKGVMIGYNAVMSIASIVTTATCSPILLVAAAIGAAIGAVVAVVVLVVKNWDWLKEKAGQVWGAIKGFFGGIGDWFGEKWNAVKDVTTNVWNGIKDKAGGALDGVKQYAGEKLGAIKQAYDEHGGGIKGAAYAAMEGVKQYFGMGYDALNAMTGGKLDAVKGKVQEGLNAMKASYEEHGGGIKGVMGVAMDGVQNICSGAYNKLNAMTGGKLGELTQKVGAAWDSLKNKTSDVWAGICNTVKGFVNKIISAVNSMIRGINKLKFDAPDWVPGIGGKSFGINIPEIPMLAKGGAVASAGSAIVGEKGPELLDLPKGAKVTPLNKTINNSVSSQKETNKTEKHNTFYITINADGKSTDDIVDELVPKLKLALSNI